MEILVIDGQGGGLGRQLVAAVKKAVPQAVVTAIGTNSAATSAMLKAGADRAATGENAVVVGCRRADVILGPIGIVMADALLGEITPAMAQAVAQSDARRILIRQPVRYPGGWGERPHRHPGGAGRRGRAGRLPELKRIGKPHKNPQKQNAENIPSPCWGTRYLLHIYHQSNIKLSSAIRCSMHQDVGRFCAARPASCQSIDIIIV